MTIECLADLTIRCGGQVHALRPGHTIDLPIDKAQRLLERAPGKVRLLNSAPLAPIQSGWRIVYLDRQGKLAGGSDDPGHGTVTQCLWAGGKWTIHLTDGQQVALSRIQSVAALDYKGRFIGAWAVRAHGYDGIRSETPDAHKGHAA